MTDLLLRHAPGVCWQCRDGGHACDYGDDRGDCWRKGRPMVADVPEHGPHVVFYCSHHAHMVAELEKMEG
jgi:hypothetical protein